MATLRQNVVDMVTLLNEIHEDNQHPAGEPLKVYHYQLTGGRPKIVIDPNFLRSVSNRRQPSDIADLLPCCGRTVRRRLLEHGLAVPGPPVFVEFEDAEGQTIRVHNFESVGRIPTFYISDELLDLAVFEILRVFPDFGLIMTTGQLRHFGIWVPRQRIRDSIVRVQGVPPTFGRRKIGRRPYSVAGPNCLWHHDGNHSELPAVVRRAFALTSA